MLIEGKKIAGILCRLKGGWFLIGLGLNCAQYTFEFEAALPPTSITLQTGEMAVPVELLPGLLSFLRHALHRAEWKPPIQQRLYRRGEVVEVIIDGSPSRRFTGIIEGIDGFGRLLVRKSKGSRIEAIVSGEVLPIPDDSV